MISDLRAGKLYRHTPMRSRGRAKAIKNLVLDLGDLFLTESKLIDWLSTLTLPASSKWTFERIPKTGTNTVLSALHYLEFGVKISTTIKNQNNVSLDQAPHNLAEAGIFMSPLEANHSYQQIDDSFRFLVIREPIQRSISSFEYLCASHKQGTIQLSPVRLRMSAMTKMNWAKDAYTTNGYEKMLEFIEQMSSTNRFRLDRHVAPQSTYLKRNKLKPNLVGRTEEMKQFLTTLENYFGAKLPENIKTATLNKKDNKMTLQLNKELQKKAERIFCEDFDFYENFAVYK